MSLPARRRIFAVTWITYAGYYFCRKNLSIVLPLLAGMNGLRAIDLANIVAGYSMFYALGQFALGPLSDHAGPKRVIGLGLMLVIVSNVMMGLQASFLWLLIFACLNGAGQSTGWSGLVKIMANWFSARDRGIVMAWWGTNYVLGGFLATAFATWAVAQDSVLPGPGWRRGFLLPSLLVLVILAAFLLLVRDAPTTRASDGVLAIGSENPAPRQRRPGWNDIADLLGSPQLWMISASYFFLEMCRYALMFWLPYYMVHELQYKLKTAGYVASVYDLTGILGAIAAGYISDRLWKARRGPISALMLFGLGAVMLACPALSRRGLEGTVAVVILAGILSYGPDTLLSGAAAQDIGGTATAASAAGLVDGIGHLGALLSPYLVIFISSRYGWTPLFVIFSGAAFLAGAILMPMWNFGPPAELSTRVDSIDPYRQLTPEPSLGKMGAK